MYCGNLKIILSLAGCMCSKEKAVDCVGFVGWTKTKIIRHQKVSSTTIIVDNRCDAVLSHKKTK